MESSPPVSSTCVARGGDATAAGPRGRRDVIGEERGEVGRRLPRAAERALVDHPGGREQHGHGDAGEALPPGQLVHPVPRGTEDIAPSSSGGSYDKDVDKVGERLQGVGISDGSTSTGGAASSASKQDEVKRLPGGKVKKKNSSISLHCKLATGDQSAWVVASSVLGGNRTSKS